MNIPSLDMTPNLPSSLSKPIISDLLKQDLGFRGLAVTDAMDMKGVVKFFPDGEADVLAIIAGNDLLELSENSKRAVKMIDKAIRKKRLDRKELDRRVKKVLAAKYWLGLEQLATVDTLGLYNDLNSPEAQALVQQLADASMTLVKGNPDSLDKSLKTALIAIGIDTVSQFQEILRAGYANADLFCVPANASASTTDSLLAHLSNYGQFVVSLHDQRLRPQSRLAYSDEVKGLVGQLASRNSFFTLLGNPYALSSLPDIAAAKGLLVGYQNDAHMQKAAAKAILGELEAKGKLPVKVEGLYKTENRVLSKR